MRTVVLAASLVLSGPALAEEIAGSAFKSGYYTGAAEADASGNLANCHLSVTYSSGETLWINMFPDDTMTIYLSKTGLTFTTGQNFTANLMMEVGFPVVGTASAVNDTFVGFTLAGNDATIDYLTQGSYFRMLGVGIDQAFDVRGLGGALALARSCMVTYGAPKAAAETTATPPLGSPGSLGSSGNMSRPIQQSGDVKIKPPPAP